MDQTGLINDIFASAYNIDEGRKGFAVPGKERQGRISYENGIALALATFQEAQCSADPQTIILVEVTFLSQELQFCAKGDTDSRNSLAFALQAFRDAGPPQVAMWSLVTVEDAAGYKIAETTHPTAPKKRFQGFPLDAFHQACGSHKTRLRNILRAPGIEMLEKALLKQRAVNMKAAQSAYVEKQRKVLSR